MSQILLTRDAWNLAVRQRDNDNCVWCGITDINIDFAGAVLAVHHLIERKLWPDGGYYVDNGVTLCETCHWLAEDTTASVQDLRNAAGITNVVLPPHLTADEQYDKWGNVLLPNGYRTRGELFDSEPVQKLVVPKYGHLFTARSKYPRTPHLPWSQGADADDIFVEDTIFHGKQVVVTEKMDGENTTMYRDYIHARSIDSKYHPSREWVKSLHGTIKHELPDNWRFCGENLYAKHSIHYDKLPSYFLLFSVWNEQNVCLDWDSTVEWAELLGLKTVPVLYRGDYYGMLSAMIEEKLNLEQHEGYVIRLVDSFPYRDFQRSVAKFVRKSHIKTDQHWMHGAVIPNKVSR